MQCGSTNFNSVPGAPAEAYNHYGCIAVRYFPRQALRSRNDARLLQLPECAMNASIATGLDLQGPSMPEAYNIRSSHKSKPIEAPLRRWPQHLTVTICGLDASRNG